MSRPVPHQPMSDTGVHHGGRAPGHAHGIALGSASCTDTRRSDGGQALRMPKALVSYHKRTMNARLSMLLTARAHVQAVGMHPEYKPIALLQTADMAPLTKLTCDR